jgi:hypothetical protein
MRADARPNVGLRAIAIAVLLGTLVALTACSSSITPVVGCTAKDGIEPICEFQNPEDIAALPSGQWLLVSQMAGPGGKPAGSIAAYEPASGRVEVLFPVGEFEDPGNWGDPLCPQPSVADFAPHGINLSVRADGSLQLLVVNHGLQDSVEFFAVEQSDEGLALFWRGCAIAPPNTSFNDVVARDDGGFWVTQMLPKHWQWWALLRAALFGSNTGKVFRWTPSDGFVAEPGSDMPFPNGIEKAPGEDVLYVASTLGNDVRRLDLTRGEVTARAAIEGPDNLTWSGDGRLLVASHADSWLEMMHCHGLARGGCGAAFEIVTLDPTSMRQFVTLAHRGAPIGGVSVAVQVRDSLYLGSVAGDRIGRWHVVGATP